MKLVIRLAPLVFLVCLLVAWEFVPGWLGIKPYLLPRLSLVLKEAWESRELVWDNSKITVLEALAGLGYGVVIGFVLGVMLATSELLRRMFLPYIVGSNSVPVVAVAPLVVTWLGHGFTSKAAVAAFLCFFPLTIGVYRGLAEYPKSYFELFEAMGATRFEFLRFFRWRHALPFVLSGLKVSATYAVIGAVVAEFVGATAGLGFGMVQASYNLNTARLMAYLIVSVLLGITFYGVVSVAEVLEQKARRGNH